MSDYNLVKSIIVEFYRIERKTIKGFFSSKIVETEHLIKKTMNLYENGELIKYEEILPDCPLSFRTIAYKEKFDNGEYSWKKKIKDENENLREENIFNYNKNGYCYEYNTERWENGHRKFSEDSQSDSEFKFDTRGDLLYRKDIYRSSSFLRPNYKNVTEYKYEYEYDSNDKLLKKIERELSKNYIKEIHYVFKDEYVSEEKTYSNGNSGEHLNLIKTTLYKYDELHPGYVKERVEIDKDGQNTYRYERVFDSNGFQTECRQYKNTILVHFWKWTIIYK